MLHRIFVIYIEFTRHSLAMADASIECCELMLTGSPQELSDAQRRFLDSRQEATMLSYRMYRELTNAY